MSQTDNFLHTTHRTVSWFKKTWANDELVLKAPSNETQFGPTYKRLI